jgi:peptide/nickel transport system substrate-binding protein
MEPRENDTVAGPVGASMTRREFIRSATMGAAALGAGSYLHASSLNLRPGADEWLPEEKVKKGGTLRAGLSGGGSSDTLDAQAPVENVDVARVYQLYNQLLELDTNAVQQPALAEEVVPNSNATVWTIRLRHGVTFHNGKDFRAEDVIYSLKRISNPAKPLPGAASMAPVIRDDLKALDPYTVQVRCRAPFSTFPEILSGTYFFMVPIGYDPRHPIGTGPFKYQSFTAGQQSVFDRNTSYWKSGLPYTDSLVIIDFANETSQLAALAANQVDVVDLLTAEVVGAVKNANGQVVISQGGGFVPFTMRVDLAPFNDVRVRQAMRLVVDRPQIRELVYGGYGALGNDIFSIWDPSYDHSIPQRHQDIDQAKSLLKKAGHTDLNVTLVTSTVASGTVLAAQVLKQQAQAAGITINIQQVTPTELYGPNYLKWAFSQDFFVYNPYFLQVAQSMLRTSPYNETHFYNPKYAALYHEGLATVNVARRTELVHEMQEIEYNTGGYIIPSFPPYIDAASKQVHGVVPGKINPLSDYGFERFWLG